jgi:hypothetical protein
MLQWPIDRPAKPSSGGDRARRKRRKVVAHCTAREPNLNSLISRASRSLLNPFPRAELLSKIPSAAAPHLSSQHITPEPALHIRPPVCPVASHPPPPLPPCKNQPTSALSHDRSPPPPPSTATPPPWPPAPPPGARSDGQQPAAVRCSHHGWCHGGRRRVPGAFLRFGCLACMVRPF